MRHLQDLVCEISSLSSDCLSQERSLSAYCAILTQHPAHASQDDDSEDAKRTRRRESRLVALADEIDSLTDQFLLNESILATHTPAQKQDSERWRIRVASLTRQMEQDLGECWESFEGMNQEHNRRNRLLLERIQQILAERKHQVDRVDDQ